MNSSLRDVVVPVLAERSLELDDISTVRAGSRVIVRVAVDGDGPDGRGPTLDEVAAASSAISAALDETEVMGDRPYVLEVGTRGVGKPLTAPQHWRRNSGRLVKVVLPDEKSVTARIIGVTDDGVELDELGFIPFSGVHKAVVQVELRNDTQEGQ